MAARPLFSVIVPTRDRPERLEECLDALARVDFPQDRLEVIVSDDGSVAPPTAVVARFADRLRVRLVEGENAGPGAARNRGAAQALGRFLVFTDDDCVAERGWLDAYERQMARSSDCLAAGRVVNGLPHNPFSTATQLIVTYVYAENERRTTGTRMFSSCNFAMGADLFRKLGGFSEAFPLAAGEDHDFCHRWQHRGWRTMYVPDAVVRHNHVLTLRGFVRQHFNYGRGLYLCRRLIAMRERRSFEVQSAAFYFRLVTFPLSAVKGPSGFLYAGLLLGSQLATLVGAAWEWLTTWTRPAPTEVARRLKPKHALEVAASGGRHDEGNEREAAE
jgi:GT2 family glycosyltransferase